MENNRTETTQKVIDTMAVIIRKAVLEVAQKRTALQAAAKHAIETDEAYEAYSEAFDAYREAMIRFDSETAAMLEIVEALGDGWTEYNRALRDAVEVE